MTTVAAHRTLGSSGLRVYPVGLGTMPLSIEDRPSERQAVRVIHAALDAGIDLIDTADCYCLDEGETGHGERLVGKALRENTAAGRVVVATKGGVRRPDGRWIHDGRPAHLRAACEHSLRHLGVDCITLYQLHALDQRVAIEESVGALDRLRREGKIRHVGLSNVGVEHIRRARAIVPIVSVQNEASPYHPQGLCDGVLAYCARHRIAFIAHSPVGGWRAGRIAHEPVLQREGKRLGASPHQLVLAWLLARSDALIPIPGASRVRSATDSAAAAGLWLDDRAREALDRVFMGRGDGPDR